MIPVPALLALGSKILDKVIPDPAARDEAKARLAEEANAGRLAELQHVEKMYGLEVEDRKSARDMAKVVGINTQQNLSYGILVVWALLQALVLFGKGASVDVAILSRILGQLDAAMLLALYFWFGSSQGSKAKDHKD
jgi:hypothetical protein